MEISIREKINMAQTLIERAIMISDTTKHDVFVWYSPHVNWIEVEIHTDGWKEGVSYHKRFWIFLTYASDAWLTYNAALKALDELEADGAKEESPGNAGTSPEPKDNTLNEI